MKRSKINQALKELEAMCEKHHCYLPPFCHFTPAEWQNIGHEYDEVRDCMLGWDITDYGMGDFDKFGFSLITIRNGNRAMADKYPKVYAEKLLYLKEGQYAPNHFHWFKTEDIINRGGGNVLIRVYNSLPDESIDYESDVTVHTDGRTYTVPAGSQIRLTPGESIHVQQFLYHDFAVEEGTGPVLLGEVSQCNDDKNLAAKGVKTILATPSAARPRWLAEKYPEVRRVNKSGVREQYNTRHNYCYTSPIYREKTAAIDRLLAERYGNNPNVILWHISNELGGECHCELCQNAFREWLKKKYDSDLDKLNHAWWSSFWSHTVTDWEQIRSPMYNGEPDIIMTGLYLDWRNFVTYQTTDFMKMEIDTIKSVCPNIPVTTNLMWLPQDVDYHYLKDYIDVVSWDSYPTWHEPDQIRCAVDTAFNHDYFRSLKHKPFLLMESTPSNTNWQAVSKLKRPGMHRLASLQAVAHGSDSVQYFQWRKGRGGSEKFHGAVIDHNGKASGRVFEDVKQVGIALEKLDEICGTKTGARVAIIFDNKNSWALSNASGFINADKKYMQTCLQHYKSFWKRGVDVDVISTGEDLRGYDLVVMPMLYSLDQAQIDRIEDYVVGGGTVVATYATGYVDTTDLCYLGGFPGGKLKDVFGLVADEIDSLYPTDKNSVLWNGKEYPVIDYCELITPTTAEVLGTYGEDFYKDMPALLANNYKDGHAYYIGCRDDGELSDTLYEKLLAELQIKTYDLPEGVSIHAREDYLFIENYNDHPVTANLPGSYRNIETEQLYNDTVCVDPYNIVIVCKQQ